MKIITTLKYHFVPVIVGRSKTVMMAALLQMQAMSLLLNCHREKLAQLPWKAIWQRLPKPQHTFSLSHYSISRI